jgi:hypothetical protein
MSQEIFKKRGYCIIKNAVSPELRDFITQYALFDEMQDFLPDEGQVIGAHSKYGDPAMESMLLNLHSLMEENTGLKLFPTYSFYRVYRNGDELVKHRDRPSCEISCTVCFNYSYDNSEYTWPIFVDKSKVELSPGDLVIYRGCDLDHWREPFNIDEDAWHVQGFFHYVNADGPYASYKYDGRDTIGELRPDLKKTAPTLCKPELKENNEPKSYIKYI